ncbi:MAG: hypothetical protein ACP5UH_02065 [Candidatus Micrarchaeia archaeon]
MANKLVTINLRKYLVNQPRTKRIRKAISYVRAQVARHAKVDEADVKLSKELNEHIFKYAARRMTPLKLSISIDNNIATASTFKEAQANAPAAEKPKAAQGKAQAKNAKPSTPATASKAKAGK